MRFKVTLSLLALALFASLATVGVTPSKAAATLLVDDDSIQCPTATFASIQAAVTAAAPGDTIQVCAGNYPGNVSITKSLTVNGAQAGSPVAGRTFAGPAESRVQGQVTIQATGVTFDGFSLTNPAQAFGIVVKTAGSGAVIKNNIIDTVGSPTLAGGGAQGVYLELGPDNVSVLDNAIRNIVSFASAKGVLVGDTSSADWAMNVLVEGNTIEDVSSTGRGGYAIQVNNGAARGGNSPKPQTASTTIEIRDNTIDGVTGAWAHAIGLEGDTPGVLVDGNTISAVADVIAPVNDHMAVLFEANPSFGSADVHNNNFNVGPAVYGIAVHPTLTTAFPTGMVDGECNWWGAPNGPGPVATGSGALVSPGVDYSPWQTLPGGSCAGAVVETTDECKNGGWQTLFRANGTPFKNQGDCIQYVNTGK